MLVSGKNIGCMVHWLNLDNNGTFAYLPCPEDDKINRKKPGSNAEMDFYFPNPHKEASEMTP